MYRLVIYIKGNKDIFYVMNCNKFRAEDKVASKYILADNKPIIRLNKKTAQPINTGLVVYNDGVLMKDILDFIPHLDFENHKQMLKVEIYITASK